MRPSIALVPWGDLFEDWLDPLGVTPAELRESFDGSWMFGYVRALTSADVDTVLVCVTRRVREPVRWVHRPTGAVLHLLPPPRAHAAARAAMLSEPIGRRRDPLTVARASVRHLAPYLATPVRAVADVVRRERCRALLCQEYETPRFDLCLLAGRRAGVPVFATFQGGDYHDSRLERLVRPRTIFRARGLIVATSTEAQRLHDRYDVPMSAVARVFNPVDMDAWRPRDRVAARARLGLAHDAVVVVWHGQLQLRRKGLDVLLDAWRALIAERPGRPLSLVLAGAGADAGDVRRLAHGLAGVELRDGWLHGADEISQLLSAGDVYVFPSRHEGFPVAPIEALACGLPVVAADAQGVPDILAGGLEHGGIVVPRDEPAALAAALGTLVDDRALRDTLARRARARAESAFSLPEVGAQLRRVLLEER